jgi:membrane protease YdiL (CAAX protease family)
MAEITKRMLLINLIISQALVLGAGLIIARFIYTRNSITDLFRLEFSVTDVGICIGCCLLLLILQLSFHKFISQEALYDEINLILMEKFTLFELFFIFLFGALAEEFLFRGILQPELDIWLTSFLFTAIHYRYYRKVLILAEVFLMGMILGMAFKLTSLLWVPFVCHFTVNFCTALLLKKGYI